MITRRDIGARAADCLMVAIIIASIAVIYAVWTLPAPEPVLTDRQKFILSRSCTDARGWPEVTDYGVACHELWWKTNRE